MMHGTMKIKYFLCNEYEKIYSINKVMLQTIPTTGRVPYHFAASDELALGAMVLLM